MSYLDPLHWAEVRPGIVLVPTLRCASSALCRAVRLMQGLPFDSEHPHRSFFMFRHVDYGARLKRVPQEVEFVLVGRDPLRRFESARHRLATRHPNAPAADWEAFIAWARHATDPHVMPVSRLADRYFAGRPHRFVRIEDYAEWAPDLGLPRRLPAVNISSAYERLPAHLVPAVAELYRRDFELFGYPLP